MSRVTRAALLAVVATLWLAGSAHAAFTGQNGRLVLGDFPGPLSTINANGTDFRDIPITFGTTMNLGSRARWSPDGTKVVFTALTHPASCTIRAHAANIRVANADGTGQRDVTQPRCINGGGQHDVQPDWSPDGRRIVFASNRAEPDGCGTFSCGARLWVTNADGSGSPRRISPSSTSLQDDSDPEFSPDARLILFEHSTGETSGDGDLRLINADGTGPVALTSGPADDRDPDWSPDASQIVFSSNRDTPGGCGDRFNNAWCDHDIYKMSPNGTGITRLTTHAGEDSHPVFSPDGRKIAWEGDGPTHVEFKPQHDLYVMNSDGTGQTNITDAARQNSFEFNDQGVAFTIYRRPDWQPLQTLPPALPAPAMRVFFPNEFISGRAPARTGTLYLSEPAPPGGRVVTLSSDTAVVTVPPSVTVPAGAQQVDFPISVGPVATSTIATITASFPGRSAAGRFFISPAASSVTGVSTVQPSVVGGHPADGSVALNADPDAPATVTLESSDPAAASVPASVTVTPGNSTAAFTVTTSTVTTTHTVTITARFNGTAATTTLTVDPRPTDVASISLPATAVSGDLNVPGTVTLTKPVASQVVVTLTSSAFAFGVDSSVTFQPNTTTASFSGIAQPGATASTTVTVTATLDGVSKSTTITVVPAAATPAASLTSLGLSPSTVTGGNGSQGTLTLDRAAPAGGLDFTVTSDRPGVATTSPSTVTVPAGATTKTFPITTSSVTASTPVVFTATNASAGTRSATLTVNPPNAPAADTVRITRAQYDPAKRQLRVEATSTSATATLRAFVDATGALIGTLQNAGGGSYKGQFDGVADPGTVRVTSSLGGSATATVSAASGTVRPGTTTPVATSKPAVAGAAPKPSSALHATPELAVLPHVAGDRAAPLIERLRLLPRRIRQLSARGTLVSLTLSEPSRVTLTFERLRASRFAVVPGFVRRTLPAGRVRIRFNGVLDSGRHLAPGGYRVVATAVDAAGNVARASVRPRLTLRQPRRMSRHTRPPNA